MQYGSKANLSTKSCLDISELEKKPVSRKLLRNYAKSSFKRKNMLEILEVAKKLPSNLWKALGRRRVGWETTQ